MIWLGALDLFLQATFSGGFERRRRVRGIGGGGYEGFGSSGNGQHCGQISNRGKAFL